MSLAVGLVSRASENELKQMSDSDDDYLYFRGRYSDLQSRVDEVVQMLCAVRPKGTHEALTHCRPSAVRRFLDS